MRFFALSAFAQYNMAGDFGMTGRDDVGKKNSKSEKRSAVADNRHSAVGADSAGDGAAHFQRRIRAACCLFLIVQNIIL